MPSPDVRAVACERPAAAAESVKVWWPAKGEGSLTDPVAVLSVCLVDFLGCLAFGLRIVCALDSSSWTHQRDRNTRHACVLP